MWLDGYLGAVEVKLSVSEVWAVVIQPSGHWGKREKGVRRIFSDASYNLIFGIYEDEDNERRAGILNSLRQGDREVGQQASKHEGDRWKLDWQLKKSKTHLVIAY